MQSTCRIMLSRRQMLRGAAASAGAAGVSALASCGGIDYNRGAPAASDSSILQAAIVAEALAVAMHSAIIARAPFFRALAPADQEFFRSAREEDMAHYNLWSSLASSGAAPVSSFYFPRGMFSDAHTTLSTLVTLEEAFVAAYLIGVRDLSDAASRVAAARVMAVLNSHRALARSLAARLPGGALTTLAGLAGVEEPVAPAENNGYARTYQLKRIDDAVAALKPFINSTAAASSGFDASQSFPFEAFSPRLPAALGDFSG